MAVITPTFATVAGQGNLAGWKATYSTMLQSTSDTGTASQFPDYSDRSVQVTGTFGAGGTLTIEGSNDNTVWATLNDPNGNALTITSTSIKAITEACTFVRPHVTAGDGTTSLTAVFFFRKTGQP